MNDGLLIQRMDNVDTAPLFGLHQIFFVSICNYNNNVSTRT